MTIENSSTKYIGFGVVLIVAALLIFSFWQPWEVDQAPGDKLRLKGDFTVTIIRQRGEVQERFTESVGLRTGDRIRISLTIPTSMVVSVGFLTGDDVYTPIVEHEWLDPGEHLLPDTFEATSGELDDLVVFADADVVDAAKSSGNFEPLNSIEIVDEEAAGLIDSDQEDGGEQEGRARVSVDWPGLLVHRTLAPRFGFRSPPGSADQIAEEDPEPADVGQFGHWAVGHRHGCRVLQRGYLECWGDNTSGQTTPPPGLYSRVSAGRSHSCGIRLDRTLECWGDNSAGQATPPEGTFTKVASGRGFSCALDEEGTVDCWGASEKMPEISTQHDGDTGRAVLAPVPLTIPTLASRAQTSGPAFTQGRRSEGTLG